MGEVQQWHSYNLLPDMKDLKTKTTANAKHIYNFETVVDFDTSNRTLLSYLFIFSSQPFCA